MKLKNSNIKPTVIHCLGDSHVCLFSGAFENRLPWPASSPDKIPLFKTYWLGALLAYNLGSKKILFDALKTIPKSEKIMLVFGEIDCRAHLIKEQQKTGKPLTDIVSDCVNRYAKVIEKIYKSGYKNLLVFGTIPSTRFEGKQDDAYPTVGTCLERNTASKLFNSALRKAVAKNNIALVDIFDCLTDKSGLTNTSYYRDKIHLSLKILPVIVDKLNREQRITLKLFNSNLLSSLPLSWQKLLFKFQCLDF